MTTSDTTKRLYLIDAFAMIYRGYFPFANRPMLNRRGEDTSAVLGFVNTFDRILEAARGQYIAVVFDPAGGTFRHEEYEEYKAQRDKQPEAISFALPHIHDIIEARGVPTFVVPGYEADDVIGTLATRLAEEDPELMVLMVTPDKDYGQLVSDRIHMLSPGSRGGGAFDELGPAEVAAKHALRDETQVRDFLALQGDASDNVPGVPGIGKKRAADLLTTYGTIEGIYEHIDDMKGKMKENLLAYKDQLLASRHLVTIVTDVPIDVSLEQMKRGPEDRQKLLDIYTYLDFQSKKKALLEEKPSGDVHAAQRSLFDSTPADFAEGETTAPLEDDGAMRDLSTVDHSYTLVTDETTDLVAALEAADRFAFEPLIDGDDPLQAEVVALAIATAPHQGWVLPLHPSEERAREMLAPVAPFFADKDRVKVAHDAKRALKALARYGITAVPPLQDTMLAHYLLDPEKRHDRSDLAEDLLHYHPIVLGDLTGTGRSRKSLRQITPEQLTDYGAEAADVTLQLWDRLAGQMEEPHLHKLYYDIEMPLMTVLLDMELTGVHVEQGQLRSAIGELQEELTQLEQRIYDSVDGFTFNIGSPKEVGELLFDRLALVPNARKTASGQYSTREEELEKIRHLHPVVGLILDYRGLSKLLSTYLIPLPSLINPRTGRIHTTYHQAKTATGRLSSSDPNLQNIPVRDARGREIRKAFTGDDPAAGDLFVSADYSQVELRLMAHLSGDTSLIDAFRHGADIHAATAAKIFGVAKEEVTPEMRRRAKTANFGIIYGISAFGLSSRLDIPRSEAADLIESYFSSFPGVKAYMDETIAKAHREGYVDTLFGRRRYLPHIHSRNHNLRANAERMAINAPIQGTAADIIKVAMIHVARRLREEDYRTKMILQVHDELCFTVPVEERDRLVTMVKEEMEQVLPSLSVPLTADVGVGGNWLEAH